MDVPTSESVVILGHVPYDGDMDYGPEHAFRQLDQLRRGTLSHSSCRYGVCELAGEHRLCSRPIGNE